MGWLESSRRIKANGASWKNVKNTFQYTTTYYPFVHSTRAVINGRIFVFGYNCHSEAKNFSTSIQLWLSSKIGCD